MSSVALVSLNRSGSSELLTQLHLRVGAAPRSAVAPRPLPVFPRLEHELLIDLQVRLQLLRLQSHGLTILGHYFDLRLCTLVMVNYLLVQDGSRF